MLTGLHWTNTIHAQFILHIFYTITSIYDESFPITKVKNTTETAYHGLRESIKHKNKLYRMSMKHPTAYNETLYKQYRNIATRLLRF